MFNFSIQISLPVGTVTCTEIFQGLRGLETARSGIYTDVNPLLHNYHLLLSFHPEVDY